MTKTDYDPERSLVLIEGLSHFITNFLQNLASCHTALTHYWHKIYANELLSVKIARRDSLAKFFHSF
jgi:hypothetical protein